MNSRRTSHKHGQVTPPPSTTASMQSPTSNDEAVHDVSPVPQPARSGPNQTQDQMTVYFDGPQVTSPPPIVNSPYPVPSRQNTETEDPLFLEWKRQQQLEKQRQQIQMQMRMHTQEPPQYQATPPTVFPHSSLPPHVLRMQQRSDSGYGSRNSSVDDYDQNQPPAFAPPQPFVHSVRQGHTYGKVIARGNAKILMGNGVSIRSNGQERQHRYNIVDIDDDVDVWQGDMPEDQIAKFFGRPPRD